MRGKGEQLHPAACYISPLPGHRNKGSEYVVIEKGRKKPYFSFRGPEFEAIASVDSNSKCFVNPNSCTSYLVNQFFSLHNAMGLKSGSFLSKTTKCPSAVFFSLSLFFPIGQTFIAEHKCLPGKPAWWPLPQAGVMGEG